MLQTIREYTQGWIAGLILTLIIFSFALWGIHSYFGTSANNSNVAKVNGIEISQQQVSTAYYRLKRQIELQYKDSANPVFNKDEKLIKQKAIQTLIETEVLKQASQAQGFNLSDQQVNGYIESMPDFQVNGKFSYDRFQELLISSSISISEFLELVKTSLLIDQPKIGLVLTSFSLPDEAKQNIALITQDRNIEYILIPLNQFLKQVPMITSDAIKAYYDEHKSTYMTPEQVSIQYIALSLKKIAESIKPSENILRNYYHENINAYHVPAQFKITQLIFPMASNSLNEDEVLTKAKEGAAQLKSGIASNIVAKQLNAHVKQESWKTLSQFPTEFQKEMSTLKGQGDITVPFKSQDSWVVAQLNQKQESKSLNFEQVKDQVKQAYVKHVAEEKFNQLKEKLADITYENPDSLIMASKELNLPIETSNLFTRDKAGSDISQYKKIRDAAFSNDVLSSQNNSEIIQPTSDVAYVLHIKSHEPQKLLPLTHVSKEIEDKLRVAEADKLADQYADSIKNRLQSGKANLQSIAQQSHYNVIKTGWVGRYANKVDPAILDLSFRLPHPSNSKNVTYGVSKLPDAIAIVGLLSVRNDQLKDAKQLSLYEEQIQANTAVLEYESYKQTQNKSAKIKMHQSS